jgi:hypothetical protein
MKIETPNFQSILLFGIDMRLCCNNIKELTLNPSLGKRGTFLPPSLHKRRGKGVELFNLSIATQTPSRTDNEF